MAELRKCRGKKTKERLMFLVRYIISIFLLYSTLSKFTRFTEGIRSGLILLFVLMSHNKRGYL